MGQSFSQVVDKKKGEDKLSEAFELLKIEKSMRDKLECIKAKLYIGALNDECLPIVCAVDKFHAFLVDVKYEEGTVKNELEEKLKKHLTGVYLEELKDLMTGVLESVLRTKSTHEVEQTHVVYANRSVLRIDYFVHLETSDLTTALFYYVQVGVIDMARVRLPVLIYELTRATKEEQLGEAGEKLKVMASSTIHLNAAAQTLSMAAKRAAETSGAFPEKPGEPPKIPERQLLTPP